MVQQRPISGTMPRGTDSLTDYHNMMQLLNSEKEKSELDMLIDLARNDVSRVCEPGVSVSDYRFVEKYSRVMHTVAQVEGELSAGLSAFDAFIACLNAGTLTGAPKAAAMAYIENHEHSRRGYYGGNVGYLTFSGQLDTGIIIRTAHLVQRQGGAGARLRRARAGRLDAVVRFGPVRRVRGNRGQGKGFTGSAGRRRVNGGISMNITMIDNFDSFTFNLVDYFRRLECTVRVYRNDIPVDIVAASEPDLLVFSPGPSTPANAGNLLAYIDHFPPARAAVRGVPGASGDDRVLRRHVAGAAAPLPRQAERD